MVDAAIGHRLPRPRVPSAKITRRIARRYCTYEVVNRPQKDGKLDPSISAFAAELELINSDVKVIVDADLVGELRAFEWVLAGQRVISHSREGWQALIDLAWHVGGRGAARKPGPILDYRREMLDGACDLL